ncbi:MAG: hypothetical protein ACI389_02255 [Methanobrevibacter sp.]|uniref:hypothetical protein n=1 Tax=Methanobrevibacter sp. TaxID=66852 RepID=UPI003F0E4120
MGILTKDAILRGINKIEKCELISADGEIYLRPLSQGEWNEINEIEAAAVGTFNTNERGSRGRTTSETNGTINVLKATKADHKAKVKTINISINNEKNMEEWDDEDILKLPTDVFNEIYDEVLRISGISDIRNTQKEVESFPENK